MNADIETHDKLRDLYQSKRWRELTKKIIERANGHDESDGTLITGRYIVDHIEPATRTNFFDEDNLQLLSIENHNKKTFHNLSMDKSTRRYQQAKKSGSPVTDLINFNKFD